MTNFYVSPSGRDTNVGSIEMPFLTVIRGLRATKAGDRLILREGIYRENSGWFAPAGTEAHPISIENYLKEKVTLSALSQITNWEAVDLTGEKAIYRALMPFTMCGATSSIAAGEDFVTCNGIPVNEAQWPPANSNNYPQNSETWATVDSGFFLTTPNIKDAIVTVQIQDSALTAFPKNSLIGSRITLLPGARWTLVSGTVLSNVGDCLTCSIKSPGNKSYYAPDGRSLYFLFGKNIFLTSPGSWWRDPDTNYLYLWLRDSTDPNNSVIEVKKENKVLDFYGRSHYRFKDLTFVGAPVNITNAANISFENCTFKWSAHRLYLDKIWGWINPALYINKDCIKITDCDFIDSCGPMIATEPQQELTIKNCVISNTAGLAFTGNKAKFLHNTVKTCPGGCFKLMGLVNETEVAYNEFAISGKTFTDGGIFLIAGYTTGKARIHHNYLHGGYAPADSTKEFYGTAGIYFESDIKNLIFDHNIIHNTSCPSFSLIANGGGKKLENIGIYNNTCDGSVYWIPTWAENPTYRGVCFVNNYFKEQAHGTGYHPDLQFARNAFQILPSFLNQTTNIATPNPDFVSNYFLSPSSPLKSKGEVITGITTDLLPEIGARESGNWISGATIRASDISKLTLETYHISGELISFIFGNIPFGRQIGENFNVKLGSGAESLGTRTNYSQTFGQTVWVRFELNDWVAIGEIDAPPQLDALNSNTGTEETVIVLAGNNFKQDSSVWFNGNEVTTNYIDTTKLEITVPFGVSSETLQIQVFNPDGQSSVVLEFAVVNQEIPTISSAAPNPIALGQTLVIKGENFGAEPYIFVNKLKIFPITYTENELQVIVPLTLQSGIARVKVSNVIASSTPVDITIVRKPAITEITPSSAQPGSTIKLIGTDFENGTVLLNGSETPCTNTDNTLSFVLPDFPPTTILEIRVRNNNANLISEVIRLTVLAPITLHAAIPPTSPPNTKIELQGNNFPPDALVFFGSTEGEVQLVTNNLINVKVPQLLAIPTTIKVATQAGAISESISFDILPKFAISQVFPNIAVAGTRVEIRGSGFDKGILAFVRNVRAIDFIRVSSSLLRITIPKLALGKAEIRLLLPDDRQATFDFTIPTVWISGIRHTVVQKGEWLEIKGAGFVQPLLITIGGIEIKTNDIVIISNTHIKVKIPVK
jgi:hypothetical protein